MKLQKILPDIIKEVVKQTLETIMTAERKVFMKQHGGTKSDFYETLIHSLEIGRPKNFKRQGGKV